MRGRPRRGGRRLATSRSGGMFLPSEADAPEEFLFRQCKHSPHTNVTWGGDTSVKRWSGEAYTSLSFRGKRHGCGKLGGGRNVNAVTPPTKPKWLGYRTCGTHFWGFMGRERSEMDGEAMREGGHRHRFGADMHTPTHCDTNRHGSSEERPNLMRCSCVQASV